MKVAVIMKKIKRSNEKLNKLFLGIYAIFLMCSGCYSLSLTVDSSCTGYIYGGISLDFSRKNFEC